LQPDRNAELDELIDARSIIAAATAQARRELTLHFQSLDEIAIQAQGSAYMPPAMPPAA
jgi:hypothetical protein